MANRRTARTGFSVIEAIIILVILGTIAAIAIPRMSHAGQNASENALAGDMAVWRNALDLYQRDHGGSYPKDSTTLAAQLTQYTDITGETATTRDATHVLGPYLRSVPPLPVADPQDSAAVPHGSATIGPTLIGGAPTLPVPNGCGWLYDGAGNVYPNTGSLTDIIGRLYNAY
jgi:type II secretory pathway pseudopilin PulG